MKTCSACGILKPVTAFRRRLANTDGYAGRCRECQNAAQRDYRNKSERGNARLRKESGRILDASLPNMQSRITGVQKKKASLYMGKELLSRDEFHAWATRRGDFVCLYFAWKNRGYPRDLTPSVDRIDSSLGYVAGNLQWLTHAENSRRGSLSRWNRSASMTATLSHPVASYNSAAELLGMSGQQL